ncbi:WW domain-containing adapter protein with coiled-coil-like [Antedon mediterranea]|uniref:WW domain-containing adapter protein with coiled-coil-like n=1 Tax=Antedon mediterranea TaxID=105859 RepID=UPI003AF6AF86
MVMHARKIPRLTDGYNEKLETHPLQAVDKLLSKKNGNGQHGTINRDQTNDGDISTRKDKTNCRPDHNSPRTYKNKASFMQKQRDRQRVSSTGSSPAENSHNNLSGAHHTASNSTEHSAHEKKIKEILGKAQQWTEHISSSGKKYYYNCKTEVSQWEKPKEWLEREKFHKMVNESNHKIGIKQTSSSSVSVNSNNSSKSGESKHSTESSTHGNKDAHYLSSSSSYFNKIHGKLSSEKQHSSSSSQSKSASTPVIPLKIRFTSGEQSNENQTSELTQKDSIRSGLDFLRGTSLSLATDAHGRLKNLVANAPRVERIESKRSSSGSPGTPSPGSTQQRNNLPSQHSVTTNVQKISSCSPSVDKPNNVDSKTDEGGQDRLSNPSPLSAASASDLTSPVVTHLSPRQQQPTPLSTSINVASHVSPDNKRTDIKINYSPQSRKSSPPLDNLNKASSSSTQSVLEEPIVTKPLPLPTITPSLARYCDDSLLSHVAGWHAEHVQRQARKINDESHLLAADSASQVSVDLKYARSLVRASEIQVTLQEQRLHFLQQQVKELERLKSENAFMS